MGGWLGPFFKKASPYCEQPCVRLSRCAGSRGGLVLGLGVRAGELCNLCGGLDEVLFKMWPYYGAPSAWLSRWDASGQWLGFSKRAAFKPPHHSILYPPPPFATNTRTRGPNPGRAARRPPPSTPPPPPRVVFLQAQVEPLFDQYKPGFIKRIYFQVRGAFVMGAQVTVRCKFSDTC